MDEDRYGRRDCGAGGAVRRGGHHADHDGSEIILDSRQPNDYDDEYVNNNRWNQSQRGLQDPQAELQAVWTQLAAEVADCAQELPEVPQLLLVYQGWIPEEAEGRMSSESEDLMNSILDNTAIEFWKTVSDTLKASMDDLISNPRPFSQLLVMFHKSNQENHLDQFGLMLCCLAMRERIIAKGLDV